ncbi:PIR Superfamily Protein [Plasmodium ovale wallikeri]|uniref:PIR Superfamily Protein n=1 Tax=Plasmodium ovale wallikeri TaxID=864142 RepID=A0A1A9AH17_PLAOA|nr:PIR Superfamily Protein [Plasmodium ovale wallikeri]
MTSKYPHLPAYKYFQEFHSDENVDEKCEKCVISSYLEKNYPWIKNLCCKLHKNIKIVNKEENVTNYLGEKHCFDLNYWLYNEVYKNLKSDEQHKDFYYIVDYLMEIWKRIRKEDYADWEYLCNPNKTLCDMEFLKEVKTLFDSVENYFVIRGEALKSLANTCSKYFDYISYNAELYYRWKTICTNDENNICTKYIDNFYSYDPERIIRKHSKWSLLWLYGTNWCIQNIVSVVKKAKELPPVTVLKSRKYVEISEYEKRELNSFRNEGEPKEEEDDEHLHKKEGEIIYDDSDTEDVLRGEKAENEDVELKTTKNLLGPNDELMKEDISGNNFLRTLKEFIPFVYKSAILLSIFILSLSVIYGLFSKFNPINKYYSNKQGVNLNEPILKDQENALLDEVNYPTHYSSDEYNYSIGYVP